MMNVIFYHFDTNIFTRIIYTHERKENNGTREQKNTKSGESKTGDPGYIQGAQRSAEHRQQGPNGQESQETREQREGENAHARFERCVSGKRPTTHGSFHIKSVQSTNPIRYDNRRNLLK